MKIDEDIRAYLGEFDPPPADLFAPGTVGHALHTGLFEGLILDGVHLKFEILGSQIVRRPDAEPSSSELEWCAVIDYRCTPATEIATWQKASWGYFNAFWLGQIESFDVIRENFARREVFDPGDLRNSLRESSRPRLRDNTLPQWIETELLKATQTWASAEVGDVQANLYCDSITVATEGLIGPTVKATQRLEILLPHHEPVINEQEVVLGSIYPEAYTSPPPAKTAVVAKFIEQLVKKQSKKLESVLKKLARSEPEELMPSELLSDPNPIRMLQKALKLKSVLDR